MSRPSLTLSKLHGTQNSFIFVDTRPAAQAKVFKRYSSAKARRRLAIELCDPRVGIGADGFVIIEPPKSKSHDVRWDFYNSDGSKAEMCGNAARCAGLFLAKSVRHRPIRVQTGAGIVSVTPKSETEITVEMPLISDFASKQTVLLKQSSVGFDMVNTGVPHAVMNVPEFQLSAKEKDLSRELQTHEFFAPRSTNVTFYSPVRRGWIKTATFERGVFDFTKACGTGAIAAAYSYSHSEPGVKKVRVDVPGGRLTVDLSENRPLLIGPAEWIADFKLWI
jgi:diaminopimelate epimerase